MNEETIRILEGMYLAICSALPNEAVRAANDTLSMMADGEGTPLMPAIVYRQLVHATEPLYGGGLLTRAMLGEQFA